MSHLQKQCAEEVQQLHLATVLWMANKARVDMHRAFCKTSIFATKDEVQSRELDVAHCQKKGGGYINIYSTAHVPFTNGCEKTNPTN